VWDGAKTITGAPLAPLLLPLLVVSLWIVAACWQNPAPDQRENAPFPGANVVNAPESIPQESVAPDAVAEAALGEQPAENSLNVHQWPEWAQRARIAGIYFAPGNLDIAQRLDRLAAQNVSVIITDSPLGQEYAAWVDNARFAATKETLATVVRLAHERGLKVVIYHTGLELLSPPNRKPAQQHIAWAQRALDGTPLLFNDIGVEEQHWLSRGIWDMWMSPCHHPTRPDGSFRQLALSRIREITETGIDGIWVDQVYLQSSVGSHHELWPSSDPCSAAAFRAETGLPLPIREDWDDPVFQRWVVWRHSQIVRFLLEEMEAARSVNPDLVFLNENSSVDSGRSTYVGNDPTELRPYAEITTGHEIETIADRMDEGETGMVDATLDDWLAFRTMVAFARASDRGKPSWILTYGYGPRDSAQLAGLVLAEGANFYETKGPQMADTVGEHFRTQLFGWVAAHEAELYGGESVAQVALLYSPRTRDLIDTVSGEPYDVADAIHFAAYRAAANTLYRAHVPFDIVIDNDVEVFANYEFLILPQLQVMSETTLDALRHYSGTIIAIGETGIYDEWLNERAESAFRTLPAIHLQSVTAEMAGLVNTAVLTTNLPPAVQVGARQNDTEYVLVLVNTGADATPPGTLTLRLSQPAADSFAHFSTLEGAAMEIPLVASEDGLSVQITIPRGIDTVALLTVPIAPVKSGSVSAQLPLIIR
jgi:hypothetical protein